MPDENEVIPPETQTFGPRRIRLNPATTYESPFFWLLIGAGGATILFYLIKKGKI